MDGWIDRHTAFSVGSGFGAAPSPALLRNRVVELGTGRGSVWAGCLSGRNAGDETMGVARGMEE